MKILSVGNSFSVDALRYLNKIAKAENEVIETASLYIGGCTLATHCEKIKSGSPDYLYLINGEDETESEKKISIKDALLKDKWDYVTIQQGSHESFNFESYFPYVYEIRDFINKYAKDAKILINETWAYEDGSNPLKERTPFKSNKEMFLKVNECYEKVSEKMNFPIIPSGKAIENAISDKIGKIHRDGFHCSYGLGRYIVGATFFRFFKGRLPDISNFHDLDEEVTRETLEKALICVEKAFEQ